MLGLFIVPINDALAKVLSTDLNVMEIVWSRFFGHFILLVPIVFILNGKKPSIKIIAAARKGLIFFIYLSLEAMYSLIIG